MAKRDITDRVQRLEVFEERLGVRLEAIYASIEGPDDDGDYRIEINGEMHKENGTSLDSNLDIVLSIYDEQGRIRETKSDMVFADEFFAFYTFSFGFYSDFGNPMRMRIIPTLT